MELQSGDKIQYRLHDQKGKEHWFNGVIHGVRRYENAKTNMIIRITYLIDTGRNTRVDGYTFDHRDRWINQHVKKLLNGNYDDRDQHMKAIGEAMKHPDLPDSKLDIEHVRQPEQIELPAEDIRLPI